MVKEQNEGLTRLKTSMIDDKKRGDLIYQHMADISNLIALIKDARDKGFSDKDISDKLLKAKNEGLVGADFFNKLEKFTLTLDLD